MGLVDWFKTKFNVGGLKVKIIEVEPITKEEGWVSGKVTFTTGKPVVAKTHWKLTCETTKGKGDEKKTDTDVVSQMTIMIGVAMEEADTETDDFSFQYDLKNWFERKGGVLGAASKLAKFASDSLGEKGLDDWYVEVTADIPGVWASPSDKAPVKVQVAR